MEQNRKSIFLCLMTWVRFELGYIELKIYYTQISWYIWIFWREILNPYQLSPKPGIVSLYDNDVLYTVNSCLSKFAIDFQMNRQKQHNTNHDELYSGGIAVIALHFCSVILTNCYWVIAIFTLKTKKNVTTHY